MPAIPEFVLRKLYVSESLKAFEGGFQFELNNTFAPVSLTGMGLTIDGQQCDPGYIYLILPGMPEMPAGGFSEQKPFLMAVNTLITVKVIGPLPRTRMVVRAETKEVGVLQFAVPIEGGAVVKEEQGAPKPAKAGIFSRFRTNLRYVSQVFRVQQDPRHPAFHFAPPANWMNDPNGLAYWKGKYHLFYQYNPAAPEWGNIHWGHAMSSDLLHWKHLPIALWPDPQYADAGGCFSGCLVDDHGTATLLYTAAYPEAQCLATSPMDELTIWQKRKQPVIPGAPQGMTLEGFRDPCVWQEAGEWRMVLGSGLTDVGGAVLLYRSVDLIEWQYMGILFYGEAKNREPFWTGTMWECPAFFPMGDKWVLIVSACGPEGPLHTVYYTGDYRVDRFVPDGPPRLLDGGAGPCFYAPQTFLDRKGKRVMIGWLREARSQQDQQMAGWSGCMSTPCLLGLSENGELRCTPTSEIKTLRKEYERLSGQNATSHQVRGAALEMLIRIPPDTETWSGVHLTTGHGEDHNVLIGLDCANEMLVVDCRHAGGLISAVPLIPPGLEELVLHVLIDGSTIEVFSKTAPVVSARFYMQDPQQMQIERVGEAVVDLWRLKP